MASLTTSGAASPAPPASPGTVPRRRTVITWLWQPVAPSAWDRLLRASGAVALAGIFLVSFVPTVGELAVLVSLTLFVNGPYSMFLPTAHEPILIVFGRLYPPALVAALATGGTVAAEYVDYRVYTALLSVSGLRRLPESRLGRLVGSWFRAQPFLTVFLCALTPIPFWIARIMAAMTRYRKRRYLAAVALGRFPRQWFYASVGGLLPLTNGQILAIGLVATLILALAIALRHRRPQEPMGAVGKAADPA